MNIQLYPGIPFSPQAELTDNIGAADTIIPVSDVSAFPPAPNLATIGTDEEGETILYAAKTETALSGCQRGVEGAAKAWQAGELIGRNFTAKDHSDLIASISEVKQYVDDLLGDASYLINAPIGTIVIWNGTEDSVPQGWSICNGENGTLDLRDKFVLGAGENYNVGDTGGSETVKLTSQEVPQVLLTPSMGTAESRYSGGIDVVTDIGMFTDTIVVKPHTNMPPYYTVLYIQKTGVTPADYATVEQVEEIVQEALSDVSAGDGINIENGTINVITPVEGVFSQSEFDALPEEIKNKGMYIIPDDEFGGSGSDGCENTYSTEETRIGTWIDGKPLYSKTICVSELQIGGTPSVVRTSTDSLTNIQIDKCIDIRGYYIADDGTVGTINGPYIFVSYISSGTDEFIFKNDGFSDYSHTFNFALAITYTKSSDQAVSL